MRHHGLTPCRWLALLFRQPPPGLYGQATLYLSVGRMEIQQFRSILAYDQDRLQVLLPRGLLTVYGEGLQIEVLTAHRITLRGCFLRTDFSDGPGPRR